MKIINRLREECAIRGAEEVPVNKNGIKPRMLGQRSHNSRYTLRSSLPSVAAVLGLRHIFSAPAFGLFGAEKTSHSGKRYGK